MTVERLFVRRQDFLDEDVRIKKQRVRPSRLASIAWMIGEADQCQSVGMEIMYALGTPYGGASWIITSVSFGTYHPSPSQFLPRRSCGKMVSRSNGLP